MIETRAGLPVLAFADEAAFERWLESQGPGAPGLWIRFGKKAHGAAAGLSKTQAIDAALCHGWIDGQLGRYDEAHWLVRFTPRKPRSKWSVLNRTRAVALIEAGRMREAGRCQIEAAREDGRWDAAYASARTAVVPVDLQAALDDSPAAARFFATLTGVNRYAVLYRIGAVKRPETRARKIATFVAMLARGETIYD